MKNWKTWYIVWKSTKRWNKEIFYKTFTSLTHDSDCPGQRNDVVNIWAIWRAWWINPLPLLRTNTHIKNLRSFQHVVFVSMLTVGENAVNFLHAKTNCNEVVKKFSMLQKTTSILLHTYDWFSTSLEASNFVLRWLFQDVLKPKGSQGQTTIFDERAGMKVKNIINTFENRVLHK
jgi:hypothetical protein